MSDLISQTCKLLGLEIGEEFKISEYGRFNSTYYIDSNGYVKEVESNNIVCVNLADLLGNPDKIIKIPWTPKCGEKYWSFDHYRIKNDNTSCWEVCEDKWFRTPIDIALRDRGWVFETKDEAEKALLKVSEELGVTLEYKDPYSCYRNYL